MHARALQRGVLPLDGPALRRMFGSRWLILRVRPDRTYRELALPPFQQVYRDRSAALYRID